MAEELVGNVKHLSLKDVARILSKNEAALRARIKRGNLPAITRPLPSARKESKRFRYLIPLSAVKAELAEMVREDSVLQAPLDEDVEPNLYQILCQLMTRHENGLTLSELRWQLERFYGLSLSEESLKEFIDLFSEFAEADGRYSLQHPFLYDVAASKQGSVVREERTSAPEEGQNAQELLRQYEQRINALESKLEILIQLLSGKINP